MTKKDYAYVAKWAKKITAIRMMGGKCSRCGETDVRVLDFHHYIGEKEESLRRLLTNNFGDALKEAAKCQIVCANCHIEIHFKKGRSYVMKRDMLTDLGQLRCSECHHVSDTLASIEFHHKDSSQKRFNISNAFSRKVSVSVGELLEEIGRCSVICRNCHRKTYSDAGRFGRLYQEIEKRVIGGMRQNKRADVESILQEHIRGSGVCAIAKKFRMAKSTVSTVLSRLEAKHMILNQDTTKGNI